MAMSPASSGFEHPLSSFDLSKKADKLELTHTMVLDTAPIK
jgi:hypothetical protein